MMNQFALHVRKSSFVRINRHPWSRGWGWGGQRRDVYLAVAHPYLPVPRDALKTALHPSAQTPGQVAGGLVIFFSSSRITWKQRALFVSALGLPCNQKGYGRDCLHRLANSCSSFKTLNSFFPDSSRLHQVPPLCSHSFLCYLWSHRVTVAYHVSVTLFRL